MTAPRILVTGGAGYIGAHAAEALARAGYTPVVYDNLILGHRDAVRFGPFEYGDMADTARLQAVLHAHQPLCVMHFAALSSVADSVADPHRYFRHNVGGVLTLLEAMQGAGVGHLIVSSTGAVYGIPPRTPILEDTPTAPINPYGRSKLMMEEMLADVCRTGALNAVALRYFNAAGASATAPIGERHEPETHIIPIALTAGAKGAAFQVNGTDYPTEDGTCVRDYVHVCDLADAHVAALGALLEGRVRGFSALNVGTGRGASVRQVLAAAQSVIGREIPVIVRERRPGDPPALIADPSLAAHRLGWRAKHTHVTSMVQSTWDFMCGRTGAAPLIAP